MKKTQEILGLPIISISNGMEVGRVKSIIINANKGAIDYIVVDSGIQILSAKVIATENVLGIGEYALTIENEGSINEISKIPAAINLLQENIQVKGTKVLTKKGRLIGEIGDIFVDEDDNCSIMGLEYIADITQKRIRVIPRSSVITFGKNLLVVTEDVELSLIDSPAQLSSGDRPSDFEKKNLIDSYSNDHYSEIKPPVEDINALKEVLFSADDIIASNGTAIYEEIEKPSEDIFQFSEEPVKEEFVTQVEEQQSYEISKPEGREAPISGGGFPQDEPADEINETVPAAEEENSAASLFEQRQRQYLSGRRSTKTIVDNSGNIIVDEGMVITDEVIDAAKQSGKLIELVMNNKA